MKRPITILNLSDLHIDADREDGLKILKALSSDFKKYIKKENSNHFRWLPDYIVVPGDVIESRGKDFIESYKQATDVISSMAEEFGCYKANGKFPSVIVTPGNHDRKSVSDEYINSNLASCKKEYGEVEKNFEKLCSSAKTKDTEKEFIKLHESDFQMFSDFYKQFVPESNSEFEYHFYPNLGETLKYVTGLKIFHEHKICFLSLNTEWLHTRSAIKPEPNLDLCKPIVKYLCDKLEKPECADYTVITLMHRKPEDLSWNIKNHTDERTFDSMKLIERYSDIIISGHDHPIRTDKPDMIKNLIQHFKLGSSGCRTKENERFPYSVSAMSVDCINLSVELLNGIYDDNEWHFSENGIYPLGNKYLGYSKILKGMTYNNSWAIYLKAKSSDLSDIERSISSYFRNYNDKWTLQVKSIDEITDKLSCDFLRGEKTNLVLYSLSYKHSNSVDVRNKYNRIKESLKKELLLMEVVVNMVFIDIPSFKYLENKV